MGVISKGLSVIFVIGLVASPLTGMLLSNTDSFVIESAYLLADNYETENPMYISEESSFSYYGWSGSGTFEDPYLLEGVHITSEGKTVYHTAITIENVDCYFEIRDCIFTGISFGTGLRFSNLAHVSVVKCQFNATNPAIWLFNCNDTNIVNNYIVGWDGIILQTGEGVKISSNYIRGGQSGIRTEAVHNASISNNTILYSDYGIHHIGENGRITNNIVAGSGEIGIWLEDRWGNNSIYGNHVGYSGEYNARDSSFGTGNLWDDNESRGNYWSDLGDNITYSISGKAGSVDRFPSQFTIDVLGPVIHLETPFMYEQVLETPDNSFTFRANVSDVSGVDTVLLYTKYREGDDTGWSAHEMQIVSPTDSYPYQCKLSGLRTGNIDFYVWANDTLGHWDISYTTVVWVEIPGFRLFNLLFPYLFLGGAVIVILTLKKILSLRKASGKLSSQNLVTVRNS